MSAWRSTTYRIFFQAASCWSALPCHATRFRAPIFAANRWTCCTASRPLAAVSGKSQNQSHFVLCTTHSFCCACRTSCVFRSLTFRAAFISFFCFCFRVNLPFALGWSSKGDRRGPQCRARTPFCMNPFELSPQGCCARSGSVRLPRNS